MGEIPSNPYERNAEALLTAAVDIRLPPLTEHQPIQIFEGPIKGIKREVQLVEGDAIDGRYLYLKVSSSLEAGATEQYSVRAYRQTTAISTTYTWAAGEPIKVIDQGEDRELQENEIETLAQRIYSAPVYDPRLHKISTRRQKLKQGTAVIRVAGEQQETDEQRGIGKMILNLLSKLRRW